MLREAKAIVKTIKGSGWTAWKEEETDTFTAETSAPGAYHLYEINRDIFEKLEEGGLNEEEKYLLIHSGRHLYMSVNDRCGPPYDVVFDEDYETICPLANVCSSGHKWPAELTDAAVEVFASEKQNREQRRKKREEREKQGK